MKIKSQYPINDVSVFNFCHTVIITKKAKIVKDIEIDAKAGLAL